MEPFVLAYYASVCAVLSFFSPFLGGMLTRLLLGAVVGVIAAFALPAMRTQFGY